MKTSNKNKLYLPLPERLPTVIPLDKHEKIQLTQVFQDFFRALALTSTQDALTLIQKNLDDLRFPKIKYPASHANTTVLKDLEIQEYNNYFQVNHGETEEVAICLTRSILTAYKMFLLLQNSNMLISPHQLKQQKEGFKVYAELLARACLLNLEEIK